MIYTNVNLLYTHSIDEINVDCLVEWNNDEDTDHFTD